MSESLIVQNLEKVRFEIAEAEKKSGRPSGSVSLCAVSKFHPKEAVVEALNANQILFGENRVQEAFEKFNLIKDDGLNFNLHIIGSLQSNKVKKACQVASCIQSVDRLSLLEEIEKQCSKLEKNINVFFEFHTAEDSKSGYGSESELFESIEKCAAGIFPHIVPQGLMTMAPFTSDEIMVHKSFETLRLLRDKIYSSFDYKNFELSMGMSGDYKIAIEEGSTMVRVGTAIFGERDYSK